MYAVSFILWCVRCSDSKFDGTSAIKYPAVQNHVMQLNYSRKVLGWKARY